MTRLSEKPIFEAITEPQARLISALIEEGRATRRELYTLVEGVTGFASRSSLSKQEASFIIDRIKGETRWKRPLRARTAGSIPGDASNLPYYNHVFAIRKIAAAMRWDRFHFQNYIEKWFKIGSLQELDRETGRGLFVALQKIQLAQAKKRN